MLCIEQIHPVGQCMKQKILYINCFIAYIVDTHYVSLIPLNPSDANATNTKTVTNDEQKKCSQQFQKLFSKMIPLDLNAAFKKFAKQINENYSNDDIIQNPCYLMLDAETIIGKLATWSNSIRYFVNKIQFTDKKAVTFDQAIERLERAVQIDPIFAFSALVNHAYCLIHLKPPTSPYKIIAKSYLVRAQEQIGKYILPQLHCMQLETNDTPDEFVYEDLVNQTRMKVEILQLYQSHIAQAIATIEASQKLVDVRVINENQVIIGRKIVSR